MIRVAILGSTGSIGESTLNVVRRHPDAFRVTALATHRRVGTLETQVREFQPAAAVVASRSVAEIPGSDAVTTWSRGREALVALAVRDDVDVVVNAVVGAAGLEPTLAALGAGKRVALANKESLVAGGELVLSAAREGGGELVPVDSEHSAILQCLQGCPDEEVARVILTASGGPFRGWPVHRLREVGPSQALNHPTWSMGAKISIDSATLANKALEVIEGHFLFGVPYDAIEAVVHPQSIVHSFVEFVDGSILAQVGDPTMELPILYALTHPRRRADRVLRTFDPVAASPLTFERVDREAFPLYGLGVGAGATGGLAPAYFNAANEVAVEAFLQERIGFMEMAEVVAEVVDRAPRMEPTGLDVVLEGDREARRIARAGVQRLETGRSGVR
ncbi:MAG TPA: 1-deoxy-D-xylulose-5-phosphate reductoisomerase [Longimicrobiales bacterium]|nr:1-deoxy-D-xylulose-5-phosphate reductoisomerase [Longimicrobiales bacterium]